MRIHLLTVSILVWAATLFLAGEVAWHLAYAEMAELIYDLARLLLLFGLLMNVLYEGAAIFFYERSEQ